MDEEPLINRLRGAVSDVDGKRDIAPEHADGRFFVDGDDIEGFYGKQGFRFMDYGVEITLGFDAVEATLAPEDAVALDALDDKLESIEERIEVTEPMEELPSGEDFHAGVSRGPNHKRDGEFAAYPGDEIYKHPMPLDVYYGHYTGVKKEQTSVLEPLTVTDRVSTDTTTPSAAAVLNGVGILDETVQVVNWVRTFCGDALDWNEDLLEITEISTNVYADATRVNVTL